MKLGGYLIGYAIKKKSGIWIEKKFDKPIHNTITKSMLNNLLEWNGPGSVFNGNSSSYANYRGNLWCRNNGNRYGVLYYAALGNGTGDTNVNDTDLKNRITDYTDTKKTGVNWCGTYFWGERKMSLRISHQHTIIQNFSITEFGLYFRIYPDGAYSMTARVQLDEPIDVESGDTFYSIYELEVAANTRVAHANWFGFGPCVEEGAIYGSGNNNNGYGSVSFESLSTSGVGQSMISSTSSLDGRMAFMEPIYNENLGTVSQYKLKNFTKFGNSDHNFAYYWGGYFDETWKTLNNSIISAATLKPYVQDSFYREVDLTFVKDFMGATPCYAMMINGTIYRFGYYDENNTFIATPITSNDEMVVTLRQSFSTDLLTPTP